MRGADAAPVRVNGVRFLATSKRSKGRDSKSLTAHPLFPAIIALWFGSLFGLGSLALRTSLIERAILATHIDLIVPAAAPPLGMTARILIALALAVVGSTLGITLARRINRPRPEPRERSRGAEPVIARGPAYAGMEQENGFVVQPDPGLNHMPPGRRRALAMVEETSYADDPVRATAEPALPSGGPKILDVTAFDLSDPVETQATTDLPPAAPAQPVSEEPAVEFVTTTHAEPMTARPQPAAVERAELAEPNHPTSNRPREPESCLAQQTALDPAPPSSSPIAEFADEEAAPIVQMPERERFVLPQGSAAERIAGADLTQLSPVELIERLAMALQRRRVVGEPADPALLESPAEPVSTPASPMPLARLGMDSDEAEQAPVPAAAIATQTIAAPDIALPAALRPLDLAEFDEDDAVEADLPPRHLAIEEPEPVKAEEASGVAEEAEAEAENEDDDAALCEAGYSSLLAMSRPAASPAGFVRIVQPEPDSDEIEPAVIFPGQDIRKGTRITQQSTPVDNGQKTAAAAEEGAAVATPRQFDTGAAKRRDPAETEQALRSALATLQRMSGAA